MSEAPHNNIGVAVGHRILVGNFIRRGILNSKLATIWLNLSNPDFVWEPSSYLKVSTTLLTNFSPFRYTWTNGIVTPGKYWCKLTHTIGNFFAPGREIKIRSLIAYWHNDMNHNKMATFHLHGNFSRDFY